MQQLNHENLSMEPVERHVDADDRSERRSIVAKGPRTTVALADVDKSAADSSAEEESPRPPTRRPRPSERPRSRASISSMISNRSFRDLVNTHDITASIIAESNAGSSSAVSSQIDLTYDYIAERRHIREFYEKNGYMPAPRQAPDALRRRLRVIRRLGLEHPESFRRQTLDRFTRLASKTFKTKMALISIVLKDRQLFLSEIGFDTDGTNLEVAFCPHAIIGTGKQCLIVPDAKADWRFSKNPLVDEGKGKVQFYAGAPLIVGSGPKSAIIGSLCVIDDKPRSFSKEDQILLQDLAECTVSEVRKVS